MIVIATGSEVHVAAQAHEQLVSEGVKARLVSMPCWEIFERQDAAYRQSVLPSEVESRVVVEAGVINGWQRYLGSAGAFVGLSDFGASAPQEELYVHFGVTPQAVVQAAHQVMG